MHEDINYVTILYQSFGSSDACLVGWRH